MKGNAIFTYVLVLLFLTSIGTAHAFTFTVESENRFLLLEDPSSLINERLDVSSPGAALSPGLLTQSDLFSDTKLEATQDTLLGVTPTSMSISGGSYAQWSIASTPKNAMSDVNIFFSLSEAVNYEFSGSVTTSSQDQGHVQSLVALLNEDLSGISAHNVFEWLPNQTWTETGVLEAGTYGLNANTNSFSNGSSGSGIAQGSFTFDLSFTAIGTGGVGTSPVPEPSTIFLMSSGLVGLIGFNWRKHSNGV